MRDISATPKLGFRLMNNKCFLLKRFAATNLRYVLFIDTQLTKKNYPCRSAQIINYSFASCKRDNPQASGGASVSANGHPLLRRFYKTQLDMNNLQN